MSRPQRLTSARERLALVSAVLLSALAFVVAAPQAAWALPSISANPTSAPAGSQVSVSGNEFTAGLQCTLHIGSASLPPNSDPQQVGTCTVDGNGGLSGTFTVPGLSPGSYTLWACNGLSGNLCNHEFEERASAGFTVSLPPTTIPTTTTTQATTTTTTFPEEVVPIGIDVPALPDGYGLDEGIWGPSIPLRVVEGRFELPPDWLARCAPLATSTVWSFDDQDLGTIPEYPPFAPFFGPVIQPELGTICGSTPRSRGRHHLRVP
jgi:hypothetical protein